MTVFKALNSSAPSSQYPHAARWYNHIASYASQHSDLPGDASKSADDLIPAVASTSSAPVAAAAAAAAEDEDDIDLFGSDEEDDAEAERVKAERVAAYTAKKALKPKTIAKVRAGGHDVVFWSHFLPRTSPSTKPASAHKPSHAGFPFCHDFCQILPPATKALPPHRTD